jgi:hypothetical protein
MTRIKNAFLIVVLLLTGAATWIGCTKEEDIIVSIDTPTSCFKTKIRDGLFQGARESTVALIDSTVFFENCSDSSQTISYKWDFGDGTGSEEANPAHKYSGMGQYKVTLVCSNKNLAFDTSSVVISVIIGQKNIQTGKNINNAAIDIVETDSGFLLLGTTNVRTVYPPLYTSYLMKLDEEMNPVETKSYPANYRFNSISEGHGGTFIFTGTTSGNNKHNELISADPDGKVLWSKVLQATDEFLSASPTPDNGYILTGQRNIKINNNEHFRNVLVKTDASGNVLWEKLMNQDVIMESAFNVVVENDGYVGAGVKRRNPDYPNYSYQDSLIITKTGNNGHIIWKNTIAWAINADNFWHTKIARLKNGNYTVINAITRGVYYFSPSGEFLDRRLIRYATHSQAITKEGNLAILQQEYGNGFRASATGLNPDGTGGWSSQIDGRQPWAGGGYQCCASSWPIAIHALKKGGCILLANLVDMDSYMYTPVLLQLDDAGKAM